LPRLVRSDSHASDPRRRDEAGARAIFEEFAGSLFIFCEDDRDIACSGDGLQPSDPAAISVYAGLIDQLGASVERQIFTKKLSRELEAGICGAVLPTDRGANAE
jgi:hypothetical protein